MNYSILILLFPLLIIQCDFKKNVINQNNWIEHRAVYSNAGFEIEFKYPDNLVIAREIDNCLCVGINTKYYEEDQASPDDNTRHWCICLFDSTEYTADYLISSWKDAFNGEVIEMRDTVAIGNISAVQATIKSNDPSSSYVQFSSIQSSSYIQLIYFNKFSALFEVVNQDELSSEDFEIFWKSIKVEEYRKP
jgi:hypothetical protein